MDLRTAKEYLHLRDWLATAARIVDAGRETCQGNEVFQEAGDSLMMKIGETANRLDRAGEPDPDGVTWARLVANRN